MIHIALESMTYPKRRGICVELESEYRTVQLCVEGEEQDDSKDVSRTLTADEARELAAMLIHYANEAERPR